MDLGIDVAQLEGEYTGAVRVTTLSLEVKATANGITVQAVGDETIDTLEVYVGNHTWMDRNDKIIIENDEFRMDKASNYYILKKEK